MTHHEQIRTMLMLREVRGRLCRYMQAVGYRIRGGDRDLIFVRTRALGRFPGSPPRAWASRVFVRLDEEGAGTEVTLRWEFSTRGKVVSVWDVAYFRREVQGAVRTITGRKFNMKTLERAHLSVSLKTLSVYLTAFLTVSVTSVLVAIGDRKSVV